VSLLLVGMNHRSAPLALREHYAAADPQSALSKLVGDEIAEAVLVSTCNRVEVVVWAPRIELARLRLRSFFERDLAREGVPDCGVALEDALYEFEGAEAARHLFRVASSVDSMVVGEPQILGQVKDAWRAAVECGACGSILSRLHERAFACAKRVRNETLIAERPVSVARVAAELAGEIFESLEGKTALLVGAGEMIELALEAMRSAGLGRVRIANRTPARAAALAERFDASAHGLGELPTLLPEADVVLTSIGGERPLLGPKELGDALRARRRRPMFVIDIGVPRNVDPAANELDGIYLYDLDDLGGLAEANAQERRREKVRAEAIVLEEQQRFDGWLAALSAVPTIRDLRDRAERIRSGEVERALGRLDLTPEVRESVEGLTRQIVNKILHAPIARLRDQEDRAQGLATLETARALFSLDGAAPAGDPAEESGDDAGDAES
jgi:glutamyl-tRNA reductase